MYAVYPFAFGSDICQNTLKSLQSYRDRFQQEPKSIIVNTSLVEKVKAFLAEQELSIELQGRGGCLAWEVWLEV